MCYSVTSYKRRGSIRKRLTLDYRYPTHIDLANAVASGQALLRVISEPLVSQVMQKNKGKDVV